MQGPDSKVYLLYIMCTITLPNMSKEIKITKDEWYKIRKAAQEIIDQIDDKLPYSNDSKSVFDLPYISDKGFVSNNDYELNNKEKEIIKFVSNNPGCNKEYVVDNMRFSRPITLKHIGNLVRSGKIVIQKDINNARNHLLFINKENLFSEIINNLQLFEKAYFDLIDKVELKNFDIISNKITPNKRDLYTNVIKALFTPFKILMHIFQFIVLFNYKNNIKKHSSFSKSLIYDSFEQISNKLITSSLLKNIHKEDIYFNYFGSINNIPDTIYEMLKIMRLCELDNEIEKVMDNLWNISFPYLPFIDPFFSRFSNKELQNWKKIMNDFRSSIYSKKKNYNQLIHKIMSSA
jgi:hypothetical protein